MDTIIIRKSVESDTISCRNLLIRNKLPAEFSQNAFQHFFIAESPSHKISGVIGLEFEKSVGLLRSLVVASTSRGLGIGKQLVKAIEKYALSRDVTELFLLTTTARDFFENIGYSLIPKNTVPKFIRDTSEFSLICPESSICMYKVVGDFNG